jgi:Ca2+-binding EF-hand superfamily protein
MEIPSVPVNPFYVRKMKALFKCLDQNKSGLLTREDYVLFADRCKMITKADTIRERQFRRKMIKIWEYYFEATAKLTDMTPEVFAKCIASQPFGKVVATSTNWADILFDVLDLNADGKLSLNEFKLLHELFYLNDTTAEAAFKALDKNHDGVVEYDEFVAAVILFFNPAEEHEKPETKLFGPLEN